MTSVPPPTSPDAEATPLTEDDRPNRVAARERLVVKVMGPAGLSIISTFPTLQWKPSGPDKILEQYGPLRDEAASLMKAALADPGHTQIIDRHKIGAAFIMAILKVMPLELPPSFAPSKEGEMLANEILAFKTAIGIVAAFARTEARKGGKGGNSSPDQTKLVRWKSSMVYPPVRGGVGSGDFRHHAYRALYYARKKGKLCLPVLANWLFMIEQYNDMAPRVTAPVTSASQLASQTSVT